MMPRLFGTREDIVRSRSASLLAAGRVKGSILTHIEQQPVRDESVGQDVQGQTGSGMVQLHWNEGIDGRHDGDQLISQCLSASTQVVRVVVELAAKSKERQVRVRMNVLVVEKQRERGQQPIFSLRQLALDLETRVHVDEYWLLTPHVQRTFVEERRESRAHRRQDVCREDHRMHRDLRARR